MLHYVHHGGVYNMVNNPNEPTLMSLKVTIYNLFVSNKVDLQLQQQTHLQPLHAIGCCVISPLTIHMSNLTHLLLPSFRLMPSKLQSADGPRVQCLPIFRSSPPPNSLGKEFMYGKTMPYLLENITFY